MRIPIREMEAQDAQSSGPNKGILAIGAVAVLAIAGYFGYSAWNPPTPQPQPDPGTTQAPDIRDDKKRDTPKAPAQNKKAADPGVAKQNPPAPNPPPPNPKPGDPPPPVQKDFDVAFSTAPAGATITVDGSLTCTSPCSLRLTAGRHGIQSTLPGYIATFKTIEVPQVLDLFVPLPEATGILSVLSTPPGATIIVDGKSRAEKTPAKLTLREGAHKIEIVSGNLRDSHEVNIKQGGIHQVQSQW
jgi:hypothetical protein